MFGEQGGANCNDGGLHVSQDQGFGLVDAHAAVRLAQTWTKTSTVANEALTITNLAPLSLLIPDFRGRFIDVTATSAAAVKEVEYVEVFLDIDHSRIGDMAVRLISPSGKESILLNRPGVTAENMSGLGSGSLGHLFTATHHYGESPVGTWRI